MCSLRASPGAEAQPEAAGVHRPEGRGGVGHDRRVHPEARERHGRPEPQRRPLAEGAHEAPGVRGLALLGRPRVEVLGDHEAGLEPGLLGLGAPVEQLGRVELLEHRRVADLRHARNGTAAFRPPSRDTVARCSRWTSRCSRRRGSATPPTSLASGGEAVLVDPQRDAWRFLEVAAARGWRVRHVLETHVHNDYLSGALETQAATGAQVVAPARGRYEFEHRAVDEGDTVEIGGLRLSAWATPGHTPEHLSWIVTSVDGPAPMNGTGNAGVLAAFTGGSLLVGTAGRTDLLGPALTDALTSDQQHSLRRLGELPDTAQVLPTHGAGSFCSAGPVSAKRVSTIAAERFANPTFRLAGDDEATFRAAGSGGPRPLPRLLPAHGAAESPRAPGPRSPVPAGGPGSRWLRCQGRGRRRRSSMPGTGTPTPAPTSPAR